MPPQNTFERIVLELSRALSPLQSMAGSLDEFANFLLTELGWDVNEIPQPVRDLTSDIGTLVTLTEGIGETDKINYSKLVEITATLVKLIDDIQKIAQAPNANAGLLPTLIAEQFLQKLPDELLQYLLVEYLRQYHPLGHDALQLLGITSLEQVDAITAVRAPHIKRKINWSHFIDLLTKPQTVFKDVYGWGSPDFDFLLLGYHFADFFNSLGFNTSLVQIDNTVAKVLEEKSDPETNLIKYYLKMPFAFGDENTSDADFGIGLFPLPQNNALKPGFAILPYGNGNIEDHKKITDDIYFSFKTGFKVAGGIGIIVRPDQDIKVFTGFEGGKGTVAPTGFFKVGLIFTRSNSAAIRLITVSETIYVDIQSASIYGGADLATSDRKDLFAEFELNDGKLVVGTDGADSFLSTILPTGGISANFDLVLGISASRGVYFRGSGGLEIQLPTHINLGPIDIQSITISTMPKEGVIPLTAGANVKAALGPLQVVVENIGLAANLSFPKSGGNLGPLDLMLGFNPPNRVGLSIDVNVVKGGGYLDFDVNREEYAGVLELVFSEWIALKGIGLITTRMPDGSKGFSLFIIITVEFGSGIQLGYGFTLLEVGGLLGLNRIVKMDSLKEGIRTGAVESVMFPKDVIANAPRIISDLRRFFPPQQDIFLVGPMAKIGWGTPTLISAQLGVILEFPSVNITILGVIKVILPDEKADILRLQVNFIGRLEPSKKLLWFYAELYDSRVLYITLEGGFGLLINWGDNADFVISAGGFHPKYNPPPLPFPEPTRIAANILSESWARVRIEGYFAVTSNSAQFGARAELFFGYSEFKLEGHLVFDALFQFNPFFFSFSLSFSLSVKVFGIGLWCVGFSGLLEGPTPWHIEGKGSISLFFFSISVPFEHTWGNQQDTKLDPIAVRPLLEAEIKALSNWEAQVPASNSLLVSLRKLGESEKDRLVLHPVGKLKISQRKVPINFTLDKVGNQKPSDYNKFTIDAELSGGTSLSTSEVEEKFAIGQFKDLDGSSQLSSPGFEPLESGLEIGVAGSQLKTSRAVRRVIRYETIIIDNNFKRHIKTYFMFFASGLSVLNEFLFTHFLKGSAVAKSVHSKNYKKKFKPYDDVVEVKATEYLVAFSSNNKAVDSSASRFSSQAKAIEFMNAQISNDSTLKNKIHVIPNTELSKAA